MAHYYLSQIVRMLGKDAPKDFKDIEITGCEQDHRKIESGHLFFAFKGQKVDGHSFLQNAAERGALAAVVSHLLTCSKRELE